MIDAYASQPHYVWHLQPVLAALPADRRGTLYLGMSDMELGPLCDRLGLAHGRGRPPGNGEPLLVAGGADLHAAEGRPVVFVEHGAGQTYKGITASGYTGGTGRDQVVLFLATNERIAEANLAAYPKARAAIVGDPTIEPVQWWRDPKDPPVVAVTFHFDLGLLPETRWSWPNWAWSITKLAEVYEVLGHAHPRAQSVILPWYGDHGIMSTDRWEVVTAVADILVVDNSSTGPEFARTGRPILWLNANHYRRDVWHGGRFWEWTEWALSADDPEDPDALIELVARALEDPPELAAKRAAATAAIYPYIGAEAAARAVAAIAEL